VKRAIVALALLLAACSSAKSAPKPSELNDNPGTGTFAGFALATPEPRPSFTLTDTAGKPFSFGLQTAGHPTLLFFGYTRCPDVCPTTMADIHDALGTLPASVQSKVDVVFVSTDVKHDTAAVIKQWLTNFSTGTGATFIGLRGSKAQIDAAQTAAHITVAEDDGQTHSALVKLYGADDYARVSYPQSDNEAKLMAHDLPLVTKAAS
jgi:protein SCO1/2